MEKELKISELASIWNVSVPTTWNRVKKMSLKTFIKKNETNKDINYVCISDEQIKEYIVNVNNNINNPNNNGYYEETLSNNNVINKDEDVIDAEIVKGLPNLLPEIVSTLNNVYYEQNQQIININNTHNEQIITVNNEFNKHYEEKIKEVMTLHNELAEVKGRQLLLEDKAGREGLYINEINQLKTDNEAVKKSNERLRYVIIMLIMVIIGFVMYIVMLNNVLQPVNEVSETITNIQAATPQVSQPVKSVVQRKK